MAKLISLTVVIFVLLIFKLRLLSIFQTSIHNSSGNPVIVLVVLAPEAISKRGTNDTAPGGGHSTWSSIPSLSSSKSNTSGTPSPSVSVQALIFLFLAVL